MRRQTSLLAIVSISVALIAPTAVAAKNGKVKDLFPPDNNGTVNGVGHIEELDAAGNGMGRPYYIFLTPNDVGGGGILAEGDTVTFDIGPGRRASNVSKQEADSGVPISAALGLIAVGGLYGGCRRRRECV